VALLYPLSVILSNASGRSSAMLMLGGILLVFLVAISQFYFFLVAPIVLPISGILILFFIMMIYRYVVEESEKQFIKSIFKQYVTEEVVDEILANPDELLKLGGELRDVTILFADIRNFTSLSESLSPREVVDLLNEYFERMTSVIQTYGGTLDKYLGDGFMVIFGAPVHRSVPAKSAILCAMEMQKQSSAFIDDMLTRGKRPPDGIGIGINSGEAIVGNIGSQKHKEYTAIGRVVNLSARIVSIAPAEKIYISADTQSLVKDEFNFSAAMTSSFKGIDEDTILYEVLGVKNTTKKIEKPK
jgi:adenylate cyclase